MSKQLLYEASGGILDIGNWNWNQNTISDHLFCCHISFAQQVVYMVFPWNHHPYKRHITRGARYSNSKVNFKIIWSLITDQHDIYTMKNIHCIQIRPWYISYINSPGLGIIEHIHTHTYRYTVGKTNTYYVQNISLKLSGIQIENISNWQKG